MRRLAVLLLTATAGLAAAPAAHAGAYCSPTGDFCVAARNDDGVVRLRMDTFAHRGKVRACVTPPRGERTCKRFTLRPRRAGIFTVAVRWSRYFPNEGRGTYRVRFGQGATPIGRTVTFRR